MGPRETARYGLRVLRIGEAFFSGPADTGLEDRDRVLMLLWSLRGWPASTNLWPLCVLSIRPFRLRGMAVSGPTRRVTRRGFLRRTHRGLPDAPGFPPRLTPARLVPPPPPMVAGRAIGRVGRPLPASTLESVARSGLVPGMACDPLRGFWLR